MADTLNDYARKLMEAARTPKEFQVDPKDVLPPSQLREVPR
jgi:hypothetical protein